MRGTRSAKRSASRSTAGSAGAALSTGSPISTRRCATPNTRRRCCRATIAATVCIRAMPATTRWATRSTWRCSNKLFGWAGDKPHDAVILIWGDGHVPNLGPERTLSTGLDHGRDGLGCARDERLDPAVPAVSDPAAQPQARGGTRHPNPVSDALHLAGYPEANGFLQCPSIEFEDYLVDGEAVARAGADARDAAIPFGAQHILHFHRLDDRERLAGFHLLALLDDDRGEQTRHRRQQQARGVRPPAATAPGRGGRHRDASAETPRRADVRFAPSRHAARRAHAAVARRAANRL